MIPALLSVQEAALASCTRHDPETWFDDASAVRARRICTHCPVYESCLRAVMEVPAKEQPEGIWAGLSRRQRVTILNKKSRSEAAPMKEEVAA